ncbi:MAG: metallopeptidase family protein [Dehalococcoidia bacterium]
MHTTDIETIESMVDRALDELPREFHARLDNVAIVIEDAPTPEDDHRLGGRGGVLLGLYRGVPLTARHSGYGMIPPDKIVLFRRALERVARDEDNLFALVKHTVHHEIAHYFGISDERLHELNAY